MSPERWRRMEQIFCAALDTEPNGRGAFLNEACAGDTELLREVESLLAHADRSGGLLDRSARGDSEAFSETSPSRQLPPGEAISHYRILSKLGEGGMGIVYRAEDTTLRRIVALKFLSAGAIGHAAGRARFLYEAQASAMIDHPNVCAVHGFEDLGEQVFIVMMYVDGTALSSYLRAGGLPLSESLHIAMQVGEGLRAAHAKGIVHRDIKPGNILMTTDGHVRITDFGLALLAERTRLTKPGTILGTAAYMSPEQALSKTVDRRSDIWSLGVVLYQMLTGRLPFPGSDIPSVLAKVVREPAQELSRTGETLPPFLKPTVEKALAKNPDERYQYVDDLLVDLRAMLRSLPEPWGPHWRARCIPPSGPQDAGSSTLTVTGQGRGRQSAWMFPMRMALDYITNKLRR